MTLRRGFKSEANAYAREIRSDLGLAADSPLCPFKAADLLAVPVRKLSEFASILPMETTALKKQGTRIDFSAITGCFGRERVIIYNDGLPPTRSYADIMHEIAHILLMHPPHPLKTDAGGRHFDCDLEDEANWLGPALLVSEEAALAVVQRSLNVRYAAGLYKVSPALMQMRLNVTGALRRVSRAA
jgi:Zn-dependent peptidase ImmA (M78 family)